MYSVKVGNIFLMKYLLIMALPVLLALVRHTAGSAPAALLPHHSLCRLGLCRRRSCRLPYHQRSRCALPAACRLPAHTTLTSFAPAAKARRSPTGRCTCAMTNAQIRSAVVRAYYHCIALLFLPLCAMGKALRSAHASAVLEVHLYFFALCSDALL